MDGYRLPFWQGLLPAILRQIYVGRKSGLLSFIRGDEKRSIRFHSGHIAHVESNIHEDHLGEILVRRGLLDRETLDRATHAALDGGKRLGAVLVDVGLLDREGLEIALAHHVDHVLTGLFTWTDGAYEFLEDRRPDAPVSDVIMKASTGDFILAAARGLPDPDVVRYNLGDIDRPVVVTSDPLLRFQRLTLSAVDGYVLSRCDGATLAREMLTQSPFGVDAAQRSLYGLLSTGVVLYPPPPESPAAAAPAFADEKEAEDVGTSFECTPFEARDGVPSAGGVAEVPALEPPPMAAPTTAPPPIIAQPPAVAPIEAPVEPDLPPAPQRKLDPFIDVGTIPIRLTEIAAAIDSGNSPSATLPPATSAEPMDARRAEVILMWEGLATRTHFEVLGVSWDVEEAEIREAYYRLARRFHPDAHHEASLHDLRERLEDIFVRLGEAYEVLRNWHLRAAYERKVGRARPELPETDPIARSKRAETEIDRAAESVARERAWEAIRLLESALPHAEGRARSRGRLLLASIYSRSVYWAKQAEDLIRAAQRDDPTYAEAHVALARLYKARGLTVRAVSALKRALELAPSHEGARALVAEMDKQASAGRGGLLSKFLPRR
jgi:hypothetical protein